jgi:hypothetical protein
MPIDKPAVRVEQANHAQLVTAQQHATKQPRGVADACTYRVHGLRVRTYGPYALNRHNEQTLRRTFASAAMAAQMQRATGTGISNSSSFNNRTSVVSRHVATSAEPVRLPSHGYSR